MAETSTRNCLLTVRDPTFPPHLLDEDAGTVVQIRPIRVLHGEVLEFLLFASVFINPFGKVCGNGCMGALGGENRSGENVAGKVLSLHGRTSNLFGKPVPTVGT